jgi:hypothetical protein
LEYNVVLMTDEVTFDREMYSMKLVSTILFVLVICSSAFAQSDSTKVAPSNSKMGKKPHLDMLLVDLNWERLIGMNNSVNQKWFGRGIAVNLMYDYPLRRDGKVSFAIGGGFTSHNYYTDALVQKSGGTQKVKFTKQPSSVKDGGKISLNYVDVPLELRFRTAEDNREHRWKLGVGAKVGYLLNIHEKTINGNGRKSKLYYYPHAAKFRYGPTLRVGYGAVLLTGFYSFSTFFQEGKSVNAINAFSLGLTISPF